MGEISNDDFYMRKGPKEKRTKILTMNHEEPKNNDTIKTQENGSSTPENPTPKKEEGVSPPPPPTPERVLVSIKRWSENKQRYFYKPKDPDYAKKHYWKHKHDMQCTTCGAIVSTAMYRHVKSLRCLMVKDAVKKALDNAQIEGVETSHTTQTQ